MNKNRQVFVCSLIDDITVREETILILEESRLDAEIQAIKIAVHEWGWDKETYCDDTFSHVAIYDKHYAGGVIPCIITEENNKLILEI